MAEVRTKKGSAEKMDGGLKVQPKKLDATGDDLLFALAVELTLPPLRPDDVTIARLAELAGCSPAKAQRLLAQKVKSGEVVIVHCLSDNGKVVKAYRKKALPD